MGKLTKRQKIGLKLKNLRENSNLTQDNLAELLDYSVHTISRIETGKANMSEKFRTAASDFFNVDESYFYNSKSLNNNVNFESNIIIENITSELIKMDIKTLKELYSIAKKINEKE